MAEAELARSLGYHMVLLSPHRELNEDQLIERRARSARCCRSSASTCSPPSAVARCPGASGRGWPRSSRSVGIKVAPFDRYRTLDVLHGCRSGRAAPASVALYTGNDDHIWPT
ncbi:hypothetical protein GCM10020219_066660 [Nonomuraea dietziae]